MKRLPLRLFLVAIAFAFAGCVGRPGTFVKRKGDEIVVAGQLFHTGTRVITWMDPGGYDAYRVERRFVPFAQSPWAESLQAAPALGTPNRYSLRNQRTLPPAEIERLRGGAWDLASLQNVVDQFVLHYDVTGFSKQCFNILHDHRGLSVHFMLDIDGTIYQTLDLKERARHATIANDRSIGIEIANMGAYAPNDLKTLDEWYPRDTKGPYIKIPERFGDPMLYTKYFTGRPDRPDLIAGNVQETDLRQYDYTPQQYAALIKLTAALAKVFPKIKLDYPRGPDGKLLTVKLPDADYAKYQGVLGHYHVQLNKTDPGPALQWDRLIEEARKLVK